MVNNPANQVALQPSYVAKSVLEPLSEVSQEVLDTSNEDFEQIGNYSFS